MHEDPAPYSDEYFKLWAQLEFVLFLKGELQEAPQPKPDDQKKK